MLKKAVRLFLTIVLFFSSFVNVGANDSSIYEQLYGEYSIEKLINQYNVFSFGDVTSVHIVGPVVARGDIFGLQSFDYESEMITPNQQAVLFSDYHQGVSSYIKGKVHFTGNEFHSTRPTGTHSSNDFQEDLPDQYLGTKNKITEKNQNTYVNGGIYLYGNVNNPNKPQVYLTDNFIDFSKAKNIINQESQRILENYDRKITRDDLKKHSGFGAYVIVKEGENVLIEGNLVHEIQMVQIDGDYSGETTVVNINTSDNFVAPRVHITSLSDKPEENHQLGEYGEAMDLVWNIPNSKKILYSSERGNGFGHVVAPNADVYNEQGNYNGSQIVTNFYSTAEGHMWPYQDNNLIPETPDEGEKPETPDEGEKPETPDEGEKPETPDEGEKPETPDEGEKPETPDEGEKPETPEEGEKPETPDEGEKPETPDEGEKPETPDDGEKPETPEEGEKPETPEEGEEPETPEEGEKPETPDEGEKPETPDDGEKPETPEEGEKPETPEEGEKPETPDEGEKPETPDEGDKPETPEEGEKPESPDEGDKPETPEEGEKPGTPDEGEKPETPNEGDKPETPEEGEKSGTPDEGEKPETPDEGDKPETPEEGEKPGTPDEGEKSETPDEGDKPETPDEGDNQGILDAGDSGIITEDENLEIIELLESLPQTGISLSKIYYLGFLNVLIGLIILLKDND